MTKEFIIKRANDALFLRNSYRRLILVTLGIIAICFSLVVYTIYIQLSTPAPDNFATTSDGEIISIAPSM